MRNGLLGMMIMCCLPVSMILAQHRNLPVGLAPFEKDILPYYDFTRNEHRTAHTKAPPFEVRTMAEWEEVQALVVTWTTYYPILTEIIRHAREECEVIVICLDSNVVKENLRQHDVSLENVSFLIHDYNTIWIRDYGPQTLYKDPVDSLVLLDWIYNRPRPQDDILPDAIADHRELPLYSALQAPNDLVNTGGNFMVDGRGTAFASTLVLEENAFGNPYGITVKSEDDIDGIMKDFMGIRRYIKMPVLPFDGIHHIDMHMKLLDEETLLIGEFPAGESDGPQIEANIRYILSNYRSVFGTPYKVIRIPMPANQSGSFAPGAFYRTFTNSVFVNKTLLMPIYRDEYDTVAMKIMRESLPGYNIVGIDCDDFMANIIADGGALHCITHTIGSNDPLLISHQPLREGKGMNYTVESLIAHKAGIARADIFYTTDTSKGFEQVPMSLTDPEKELWSGAIPTQPAGTTISYYIKAVSHSGKSQVRPMVAPKGSWTFNIGGTTAVIEQTGIELAKVFPNPAAAITCIPVKCHLPANGSLVLYDLLGRPVQEIHRGAFPMQTSNFFFDASRLSPGAYVVVLETAQGREAQRIMVR